MRNPQGTDIGLPDSFDKSKLKRRGVTRPGPQSAWRYRRRIAAATLLRVLRRPPPPPTIGGGVYPSATPLMRSMVMHAAALPLSVTRPVTVLDQITSLRLPVRSSCLVLLFYVVD